jgi:hypothetical protein
LVIEAKRDERDLGIKADHAARYFKLNGSVFTSRDFQEGLGQAILTAGFEVPSWPASRMADSGSCSGVGVLARVETLKRAKHASSAVWKVSEVDSLCSMTFFLMKP